MKKLALAAVLAFMASCKTAQVAQAPQPQQKEQAVAEKKEEDRKTPRLERGLLWKISDNGLTEPSYLYATMHITCNATLDENVEEAFKHTRQLYLELDMDDKTMAAQMMNGIMMKDGVTLTSMASPEDLVVLDEFVMKNTGMPIKMLDKYKPGVIEMMVLPKMMDCEMQSVEEQLMKITHQEKEEVLGLETVAEQMALFDAIPYKDQMDALMKLAREGTEAGKVKFANLDRVYQMRDLEKVWEFMQREENNMGSSSDIMLGDRNRKWIPRIEQIAKAKPTFFGVGAAHLPGEDGVIQLLRDKGYKVEVVTTDNK